MAIPGNGPFIDGLKARQRKDNESASVDALYSILKKLHRRNGNLLQATMARVEGLKTLIRDILEDDEIVI